MKKEILVFIFDGYRERPLFYFSLVQVLEQEYLMKKEYIY